MSTYKTPEAFSAALTRKLAETSRVTGRDVGELRRELILQRFLARLFHPDVGAEANWILKGGSGLLLRVPTSRHTRDIDLHHDGDTHSAVTDIDRAVAMDLDPFRFQPGPPTSLTGRHIGLQLTVTAYLGVRPWDRAPIDLAIGRSELIGTVETITPTSVVTIDDLQPMPPIRVYPLPAQIADKLCAMYDRYGGQQSTRYHDLVDLITIITNCDIPATPTRNAITSEAIHRQTVLPAQVTSPGSSWTVGYRNAASKAKLPRDLQTLTTALSLLQRFLHPILNVAPTEAREWNHQTRSWSGRSPSVP